jgi:hypothetical protein
MNDERMIDDGISQLPIDHPIIDIRSSMRLRATHHSTTPNAIAAATIVEPKSSSAVENDSAPCAPGARRFSRRRAAVPIRDVSRRMPGRRTKSAGHVHSKRHQLLARPPDPPTVCTPVARRPGGTRPHRRAIETVGRPRKRRDLPELSQVAHVHADVNHASTVSARQADTRYLDAGRFEHRAHPGAIRARARVHVEICSANTSVLRD